MTSSKQRVEFVYEIKDQVTLLLELIEFKEDDDDIDWYQVQSLGHQLYYKVVDLHHYITN
jgi:hypothetical protein